MGGGIGTYWGGVRSIGEKAGPHGNTSGIIPFVKGQDSLTLAVNQGSLRRGSAAVYLDVYHPEIEEFIEIRKPTGDLNRRSQNIHHGVNITNKFMMAVKMGQDFDLVSPKTGAVMKTVDARSLWARILDTRLQTGEPYLNFIDNVNGFLPVFQREVGLKVSQSNLCVEITLPTGIDQYGKERTAVCCLSSLNAETFLEWKDDPRFIEDVLRFLDNVLQDFIDHAPASMSKAVYSATRERAKAQVMGLSLRFALGLNAPYIYGAISPMQRVHWGKNGRPCMDFSEEAAPLSAAVPTHYRLAAAALAEWKSLAG